MVFTVEGYFIANSSHGNEEIDCTNRTDCEVVSTYLRIHDSTHTRICVCVFKGFSKNHVQHICTLES